ncbi:hypothetical protein BH10BDE1_BH10BDE1_13410 [soil metagenome]
MTMPIEARQKLNLNEIMIAIVALLFLLIARPLLAQAASRTTSPSSTTIPAYVTPEQTAKNAGSLSQREASARQNGGTSLNPQAMPECRIDDSNCIEQRNKLNQQNQENAPTLHR